MKRRFFIKSVAACASVAAFQRSASASVDAFSKGTSGTGANTLNKTSLPVKTKISLNAYSFNKPLLSGEMTVPDMLEYAAQTGFEGVDLTGYYFPGYPVVPSDEYIYDIKRKAFRLGLEICGTGIRNDLSKVSASERADEKKRIKDWVVVASKLGAQTLRIFAGNNIPDGYTWDQAAAWISEDIKECARYAGEHGVVLALQNHNDFLKTADEVEKLLKMIDSQWVGLMLDIGCYRTDPFAEIEQTIKHAVTWQVKEEMYINNKVVKTDIGRLKAIISNSDYRGYLPIETLGEGDPKQKVSRMFEEVKKQFN